MHDPHAACCSAVQHMIAYGCGILGCSEKMYLYTWIYMGFVQPNEIGQSLSRLDLQWRSSTSAHTECYNSCHVTHATLSSSPVRGSAVPHSQNVST